MASASLYDTAPVSARRRMEMYVYAVCSYVNCRKTASQLGKKIRPTGKIFFPN